MKPVHLPTTQPVTRMNLRRANPLNESNMPKSDGTPESLHAIIKWLNVTKSARYQRTPKDTFCNIYAYDYAYLCGAYLPRVWWSAKALADMKKGIDVGVQYGKTVFEQNANALYDWFRLVSGSMGWCKIESKTEAQKLANEGKCVIMVGARTGRKGSGHITAIVPETDKHKAIGTKGIGTERIVTVPLQSQAGAVNFEYQSADWQRNHEPLMIYVWVGV